MPALVAYPIGMLVLRYRRVTRNEERYGREFWRVSWPAIVSVVVLALLMDRAFHDRAWRAPLALGFAVAAILTFRAARRVGEIIRLARRDRDAGPA